MSRTRPLFTLALAGITFLVSFLPDTLVYGNEDALLIESRDLTAQFGAELKAALQDAMATGGPIAAITVCKDMAPQIASMLSRESGANVGRTSLKFRNPGNAPEPWQAAVLKEFEATATGTSATEHFERFGKNGARYLKAIPTGALCLSCHGAVLPADVQETLNREYPHDRARGYNLGDIRGAFSITWPDTRND